MELEHRKKIGKSNSDRYKKPILEKFPELKLDKEFIKEADEYNWYQVKSGHLCRHRSIFEKGSSIIFLHHLVLPRKEGTITDHINRNPLDNRKCNLRYADKRLNSINRGLQSNNTSGYKGVRKIKNRNLWIAEVHKYGKRIYKHCKSLEEALEYRKKLEIQYYNYEKNIINL